MGEACGTAGAAVGSPRALTPVPELQQAGAPGSWRAGQSGGPQAGLTCCS